MRGAHQKGDDRSARDKLLSFVRDMDVEDSTFDVVQNVGQLFELLSKYFVSCSQIPGNTRYDIVIFVNDVLARYFRHFKRTKQVQLAIRQIQPNTQTKKELQELLTLCCQLQEGDGISSAPLGFVIPEKEPKTLSILKPRTRLNYMQNAVKAHYAFRADICATCVVGKETRMAALYSDEEHQIIITVTTSSKDPVGYTLESDIHEVVGLCVKRLSAEAIQVLALIQSDTPKLVIRSYLIDVNMKARYQLRLIETFVTSVEELAPTALDMRPLSAFNLYELGCYDPTEQKYRIYTIQIPILNMNTVCTASQDKVVRETTTIQLDDPSFSKNIQRCSLCRYNSSICFYIGSRGELMMNLHQARDVSYAVYYNRKVLNCHFIAVSRKDALLFVVCLNETLRQFLLMISIKDIVILNDVAAVSKAKRIQVLDECPELFDFETPDYSPEGIKYISSLCVNEENELLLFGTNRPAVGELCFACYKTMLKLPLKTRRKDFNKLSPVATERKAYQTDDLCSEMMNNTFKFSEIASVEVDDRSPQEQPHVLLYPFKREADNRDVENSLLRTPSPATSMNLFSSTSPIVEYAKYRTTPPRLCGSYSKEALDCFEQIQQKGFNLIGLFSTQRVDLLLNELKRKNDFTEHLCILLCAMGSISEGFGCSEQQEGDVDPTGTRLPDLPTSYAFVHDTDFTIKLRRALEIGVARVTYKTITRLYRLLSETKRRSNGMVLTIELKMALQLCEVMYEAAMYNYKHLR